MLAAEASAQVPDLAAAQEALAQYDLSDPRTFEALETLRRVADANGPDASRARAMWAYAGSDLLVLASARADEAALGRLGSALGARDTTTMADVLERQLDRIPRGALSVAAAEARATLGAMRGRPTARSVRSDAVILAMAPDDPSALRARVRERFEPVVDSTLAVTPEHDNEARRIVSAMRAIALALRAAEAGDPLLRALRSRLEVVRQRLGSIVIEDPASSDVDVVLTLSPGRLAFGYVPRTRVEPDGRPVLVSSEPTLPSTVSIELPAEFSGPVRPIEGLASRSEIAGARPGRVALRVEGDVPAHLLARVVRSLEGTPLAVTSATTSSGRVQVSFVREDAAPSEATRVSIRPGGYTVDPRRGRRVEVPRQRVEGRWHFDRDGLLRQLPAGPRVLVANGLAPAAELIELAVLLAVDGTVTIVLP